MCQPASFVVTKTKVFWSEVSDSHEDIIEEYSLNEMVVGKPTFVRVEISPADGNLSTDPKTWVYKLDQDIKPDWYDAKKVEGRCRTALKNWAKKKIIKSGNHKIKSGQVYAYGSSSVTAYGSSSVRAYGSSSVTACDSSSVTARDSSSVTACDSSSVTACGSSSVRAYDSSSVTACGSSSVTARDSSSVTACEYHSTVRLYGDKPLDCKPEGAFAIAIDCRGDRAKIIRGK